MPTRVSLTTHVDSRGRAAINEAAAHGGLAWGRAVLTAARQRLPTPPGRSRRATGALARGGAVVLYMAGSEVVAEGGPGRSPADAHGEIVVVVGFPFPGRFLETGRTGQAPAPFLGPGADTVDPKATVTQGASERWPR